MCVITEEEQSLYSQGGVGNANQYLPICQFGQRTHQNRPKTAILDKIVVEFMVLFVVLSVNHSFVGSSLVEKWQREGQGS